MNIRSLYNRILILSGHPKATWLLAIISFLESSIFPIPPDALLLPMGLSKPHRAYYLALICTIASVAGGLFGYAVGYFFYETIGVWIVKTYHLESAMATYQQGFLEWGVWIILVKGLTPIPYKLVTIASGIAQFDLTSFILASIVTRGGRFFLIALFLRLFGEKAKVFIEQRLTLLLWLFLALLIAGFGIIFLI